jgi:hypothetical protein
MKKGRTAMFGSNLNGLLPGCALLLNATLANAQVTDIDDVWRGGTGSWSTPGKWTHGVPNNGTPAGTIYNVFIDDGNAALSSVTLNTIATINNLSIDSGDRLTISDGNSLTVTGSSIANAGKLSLNASADSTDLIIGAPNVTLSGGGTLTLSDNANNRIFGSVASNTLTNQGVIQGAGQIGAGQLTLVNSGTINANQTGASLIINTGSGFTNTGLVEATASAGLVLEATTVTNTGGTLSASGSGAVYLEDGTTINGGTLKGTIYVPNTATLSGSVSHPTGVLTVLDAATLSLENGSYLGKIQINSQPDTTSLLVAGTNVTLSGGSTVTLSDNINNRIYGSVASNTLTNQGVIQGAGQIGTGQLTLVNSGTINANQTGASLIINTGSGFTNTGLVEAIGSAGLVLEATTVTNAGGTLSASGAGAVYLESGTTINGGTLKGTFYVPNAATFGSPLNNSAGVVMVEDSAVLTLKNGNYSQLGNVQLNSAGDSTDLIIAGTNVTVGGSTLTLSNSALNRIYGSSASNKLTNQGTIQGAGQIGAGQLTLVNSGTISANQSEALTINASLSFTNNGTLAVTAGDLMLVMGGTFSNFKSGVLRGGTYNVAGTLQIDQLGSGGGEIVTNAATVALNGAASSVVDSAGLDALAKLATNSATGNFSLAGSRNFTTVGKFSNAGSFTIGTGSTFTVGGPASFTQSAGTTTDNGTLSGTGGVHLSGGSLFGIGTVNGNLQSSGIITPGKSAATTGILTTAGAFTQNAAGSLDIAIGGTAAGTKYDELNATTANLGGNLNIDLINGFVPAVGATFKVVNFNSGLGQFSAVNGLAINGTEHFTISYQASDVLLKVVSGAGAVATSSPARFPKVSEMSAGSTVLAGVGGPVSAASAFSAAQPFNFALPTSATVRALPNDSVSQFTRTSSIPRMVPVSRSVTENLPATASWARLAQTSRGAPFSGLVATPRVRAESSGFVAAKSFGGAPSHMPGGRASAMSKMSSGSLMISTSGLFSKPHIFYSVN